MVSVATESAIFFHAVLTGIIVHGIYTCIQIFRKIIHHKRAWVSAEDFAYWIAMSVYVFMQMYQTSYGSIRWYFLLGLVLGALLYHMMMKKIVRIYRKISLRIRKKRGKSLDKTIKTS